MTPRLDTSSSRFAAAASLFEKDLSGESNLARGLKCNNARSPSDINNL